MAFSQRFALDQQDQHLAYLAADGIDRLVNSGQWWVGVLCQRDIVKASDCHIVAYY